MVHCEYFQAVFIQEVELLEAIQVIVGFLNAGMYLIVDVVNGWGPFGSLEGNLIVCIYVHTEWNWVRDRNRDQSQTIGLSPCSILGAM